jgi:hypothetical protein
MKYSNKGKGYNRKGYSWGKSQRRFRKTGFYRTVSGGSGHEAGAKWGDAKQIDPDSQQRRYSKNSPSFDEGVKLSKISRRKKKADAVEKKIAKIAIKML